MRGFVVEWFVFGEVIIAMQNYEKEDADFSWAD
jgi:hypothetical protein